MHSVVGCAVMAGLWLCLALAWLCGLVGCVDADVMGAEGGYFMREHSLVVPYQGQLALW